MGNTTRGAAWRDAKGGKGFAVESDMGLNFLWCGMEDSRGNFWFGGRGGVVRYDGESWQLFTTEDGLAGSDVRHIIQDREDHLWFCTAGGGVSRYDGRIFQVLTSRDGLNSNHVRTAALGADGALWFGTNSGITRYEPDSHAPTPVFIDAVAADGRFLDVSQLSVPASLPLIAFEYSAVSMRTRPEAMVFRYRLEGYDREWHTTHAQRVEYGDLPVGTYVFQVEAVDRDLVYSASPATVELAVHLPYDQIGWVFLLVIATGAIAWQTVRVMRRGRDLTRSNEALSDANQTLFTLNVELQHDRAAERIRAEVQSMDEPEDFERVLSLLTSDLKEVGLSFQSCEIDVLVEPVANPSMKLFEEKGFHYSTYTLNQEGQVASRLYRIAAPFPPFVEKTIERFIAGEPWQGTSENMATVEVPVGRYGRLRLIASERDSFTEAEVSSLREFGSAVSLGYARYLDIREIQEQTERKSAFLASMSHELRTPMNAIKGFTNLVLGRRSENLNDRQRENLGKVSQASDHLLAMINDLLDLSKIEAGRMDVSPERFDVSDLVTSACDTVSPLIQEAVELRQDVADDIGEANTDKARLLQMVINLLSNAIKFTESGTVTVTARRQQTHAEGSSEKETHDSRLTTHDSRLTTHDSRLTTHDSRLTTHDSRLTTHDSRLTTHDSRPCSFRFRHWQGHPRRRTPYHLRRIPSS